MNTEEKLLKLKKLADAMYYAAQYLTTDASRLRKTMEDYHQFIIHEWHKEEPVSVWHDASKKSDNPEDVVIINPSDNTGEVLTKCTGVNQGHIWAYTSELLKLDNLCNIGKNLQEPQVKESAEIQHVNDMCKENGNSLTKEPVSEVWHDAQTEQPQAKEKILATNEYGDCEVDFAINMALYWPKVIKWAYIDDLLKLDNSCQSCENLQEEPVSEDIEEAAESYAKYERSDGGGGIDVTRLDAFIEGAQWQKQHLWKPADGDDLPIIDREVIALLDNGKVVFAHRPPEYWDGKNIITGKVTRNYPKTYDKGGWNIPDVKWWIDVFLPKMED